MGPIDLLNNTTGILMQSATRQIKTYLLAESGRCAASVLEVPSALSYRKKLVSLVPASSEPLFPKLAQNLPQGIDYRIPTFMLLQMDSHGPDQHEACTRQLACAIKLLADMVDLGVALTDVQILCFYKKR